MTEYTPKYRLLKQAIKDWALNGEIRPGEQIPTENQLSEQFMMSRQTVRMAINELVHENVLYRRQGKGTFISEEFLQPEGLNESHRIIAVITTYISDYIFPSIIRGIESRLSQADYSMLLLNTDNDLDKEAQALERILRRPIDGVIVEPTKSTLWNPNLRRYMTVMGKQVPMVMLHSSYPELALPCVRMDDELGGYMAAEHLLKLGHTKISMITKVDDTQGRLRLRGFIQAHQTFGVPIRHELMHFYMTEDQAAVGKHCVELLLKLRADTAPSAIVCYNDLIGSDIVKSLGANHVQVPDDMSIISFDDSQWAEENQITSIQHPKFEMGVQVADVILKAMDGQRRNQGDVDDVILEPKLINRSSTRNVQVSV